MMGGYNEQVANLKNVSNIRYDVTVSSQTQESYPLFLLA